MIMTNSVLKQVLAQHELWLETACKEGKRADLFLANLAKAYLPGANLLGANLTNANLTGADLRNANLTGADLADAGLANADLLGANLPISIRDCWSFRRAKFSADALPWLILHPEWAEFKDTVQITG